MTNRLRRGFLLATIVLSCVFSAHAQAPAEREAVHLTPAAAVDMAIRNNLHLEMARINLDISRRRSNLVWNQFLPTVGVTGTLSRSNWATSAGGIVPIPGTGTPITVDGISGRFGPDIFAADPMTLPRWNVIGALNAELIFSFALIEGIQAIRNEYAAGLITLERAKLQMEQGIRKMYNGILLLKANVDLLKESYRNTQRQAEMAEASFRAGLAPRLAWLQAQVAVENMRPAVRDLENTLESLKGNFALLLGLPHGTPFVLQPISFWGSVIPWDLAEMLSRAASGKPDIQELQANIITLQSQRQALRLQNHTPFIMFGWTLSTMFDPTLSPFRESWFTRDNWTSQGQAGGAFSVTVGMNFNSLFSHTREGQQLRDMDAALQMQNIMLAQTIRETELEVFSHINSLERIRTNVEVQQATVYLAEESFRLTEEAFRAGLQDFQSVQNAALALDQARLRVLTEQFNYLNYLIDLEYSLGIPFGTLSGNGSVE